MKRREGARLRAKSNVRQWVNGQRSRRERGRALEVAAAPMHANDRPPVRERAVLKVERRARALQQGLGDEKANPQPPRLPSAARSPPVVALGLADPAHDSRGKARPATGDGDAAIRTVPGGGALTPLVRE